MWFFCPFYLTPQVKTQSFTKPETAQRLTWSWPSPSVDFLVWELYNCFDIPLSNTSALWSAPRHGQQGFNPSVEPSPNHRVLIHWDGCGVLWVCSYGCSLKSVLRGVLARSYSPEVDPKLEGMKVESRSFKKTHIAVIKVEGLNKTIQVFFNSYLKIH